MAEKLNNIFDSTLSPKDVTTFTLMRGVPDYTNLAQFDLYETGYSFLVCLKIPEFLNTLADTNTEYETLIKNYTHILEYDFRGAQGIEDITTETAALTNGISDLNIITRTTEQGGTNFTMNYFERSGSLLTKVNDLYIRGIKDPRTQMKRYNGLLRSRVGRSDASQRNLMNEKGYQYEVFHFLLIVTDNTGLNVEKAYILASAQPSLANTSIYNVTRGEISFQEISLGFNAYPISGRIVNQKGAEFLDWINDHTCFDEMEFGYDILCGKNSVSRGNTGVVGAASPTVDNPNPDTWDE